jgi:hypothetical protein
VNADDDPQLDTAGTQMTDEAIIAATRVWLEKVVIGLGLCPFAASVYRQQQIRYRVSEQRSTVGLLGDLEQELLYLQSAEPRDCETSLLIHPQVLGDFRDYNDFLDEADALLRVMDLEGELQIASFHPQYEFADAAPDAIENYGNRSPYPMLHLLREASVTFAITTYPGVHDISSNNMKTLRRLGKDGWQKLWTENSR